MPGRVNIYCSQERRIQVPQSSDGPRPDLDGDGWYLHKPWGGVWTGVLLQDIL